MSLADRDLYRRRLLEKEVERIDRQRAAQHWSATPNRHTRAPGDHLFVLPRRRRWSTARTAALIVGTTLVLGFGLIVTA